VNIRIGRPEDVPCLLDVWLRAVRVTHKFLSERDIEGLVPAVRQYLDSSTLWVACLDGSKPIGFMGLTDGNVDSLFIAPEHFRIGAGRTLLAHARGLSCKPLRVEVNEQNPGAVKFYEANGFKIVGRSPVDHGGRPFPLLQMSESSI
jgi:putative acetyltransferase